MMSVLERVSRRRIIWLFMIVVQTVYIKFCRFMASLRYQSDKGFPYIQVFGTKHNMPKRVTNLDNFERDLIRVTVFLFYDKLEFFSRIYSLLNWKTV
jgi:hypothetical protein